MSAAFQIELRKAIECDQCEEMIALCTSISKQLKSKKRSFNPLLFQLLNNTIKRDKFMNEKQIVDQLIVLLASLAGQQTFKPQIICIRKIAINLMIRICKLHASSTIQLALVICQAKLIPIDDDEGVILKMNSQESFVIHQSKWPLFILHQESNEVSCAYYLCFVGFLLEKKNEQQEFINFIFSTAKGPANLLLASGEESISIIKLISRLCLRHSPLFESKLLLKRALEYEKSQHQCPCDFIVNSCWFVKFDEHFADFLDYVCFFVSKSRKFTQAIRVLEEISQQSVPQLLKIGLFSLEIESFLFGNNRPNNASKRSIFMLPEKFNSEKEQRKAAKFIVQIEQLCQKALERAMISGLKEHFGSQLQLLATWNDSLFHFVACNILTRDQILDEALKIPNEIKIFALLSHCSCSNDDYGNEDEQFLQLAPANSLARNIYHFKRSGKLKGISFQQPENPSSLDFFSLRPLMLICLLQGEFELANDLYHFSKKHSPIHNASFFSMDFIFCLVLFEMGIEEPSRSKLAVVQNQYAQLLYLFISNSFGRKEPLTSQTSSPTNPSIGAFLFFYIRSLIELIGNQLEASYSALKHALKITDCLMQMQSLSSVFEHVLLLSYFHLLGLLQICQVSLVKGNAKNALWFCEKGLELSRSVKSSYFLELFEAKKKVLLFMQTKTLPSQFTDFSSGNLRAFLDLAQVKPPTIKIRQNLSEYYQQKYRLLSQLPTEYSRLYSDDLLRAKILFTPQEYLENFISCLIAGSIKTIDESLFNILDQSNLSDYQKAACIEISRGISHAREMKKTLDHQSLCKWINGDFHSEFIPDQTRVITFKGHVESSSLFISLWTKDQGLLVFLKIKFPLQAIKSDWLSIMQANKASLTIPPNEEICPLRYWNNRKQSDQSIGNFLSRIQDLLGIFSGIFTLNPLDHDELLMENVCRILGWPFDSSQPNQKLNLFLQLAQESFPTAEIHLKQGIDLLLSQFPTPNAKQISLLKTELEYHRSINPKISPFLSKTLYVPCKELFGIPLENIPLLSDKSIFISRISSLWLLPKIPKFQSNPKVYCGILNPQGDLTSTQSTFEPLFRQKFTHFHIGSPPPSQDKYLEMLQKSTLFIYCGHGGAETLVKRSCIMNSQPPSHSSSEIVLMGCSSGRGEFEDGWFDVETTPNAYLSAGYPLITATLWDVTDKDIDRVLYAALTHYFEAIEERDQEEKEPNESRYSSLARFIHKARNDSPLLKNATGKALVFYGID